MKIENIRKALSKKGIELKEKNVGNGIEYVAKSSTHTLDWIQQEHNKDEVTSVYIKRNDLEEDYWRDSYVGSFYDTIKSIVKVMGE